MKKKTAGIQPPLDAGCVYSEIFKYLKYRSVLALISQLLL